MKGASVVFLSLSLFICLWIATHFHIQHLYKSITSTQTRRHTRTQLTVVVSCWLSTLRPTFALTISWSLVSRELLIRWSFHLTAASHVSIVMHKLNSPLSDDLVTNEAELIACCISFSVSFPSSVFRLDNLHINTCMEYPIADGNDYHKVVQLTLCRFGRTAHMSMVHGRRIIAWVGRGKKEYEKQDRKCVKIN